MIGIYYRNKKPLPASDSVRLHFLPRFCGFAKTSAAIAFLNDNVDALLLLGSILRVGCCVGVVRLESEQNGIPVCHRAGWFRWIDGLID